MGLLGVGMAFAKAFGAGNLIRHVMAGSGVRYLLS